MMVWRPTQASRWLLVLLAALAVAGQWLVESYPVTEKHPLTKGKLEAAQKMLLAMEVIRNTVAQRRRINPEVDPAGYGLIGLSASPITSKVGDLRAKQATSNPNFAAVMVDLLQRAGLERGDVVAMGFSGSFPALNIAALVAAETLGLRPIVISSASASMWGANDPELTWLDMERMLADKNVIRTRSIAASFGGLHDTGEGISEHGMGLLETAAKRNQVRLLRSRSLQDAVMVRLDLYETNALRRPIKAYVNIGGSAASVGSASTKRLFQPGLNLHYPRKHIKTHGVMSIMSRRGLPVINMVYIRTLCDRYNLPYPLSKSPGIDEGRVFYTKRYNIWLTALVFVVLAMATLLLLRFNARRLTQLPPDKQMDAIPHEDTKDD